MSIQERLNFSGNATSALVFGKGGSSSGLTSSQRSIPRLRMEKLRSKYLRGCRRRYFH